MKILLKLTSSKVDIEYMDTQPFIQGTDTRNKIYVYRDSSETPSLTDLSIAYQVQSGRTTLPLSNSGATTEEIDGTTYTKYTFNVPSTATSVAGNVVACLVTKTSTASFKTNIINRVLDSSEFDAFQSGLTGAAETYATAMESLSSANTIQDGRLTNLENATGTEANKIGLLNTEVFGTSYGTATADGLKYIVRTNHEGRIDALEDLNISTRLTALEADDIGYFGLADSYTSGTLTDNQFAKVSKHDCVIVHNNKLYLKNHYSSGRANTYFTHLEIANSGNYQKNFNEYIIDVNMSTKVWSLSTISFKALTSGSIYDNLDLDSQYYALSAAKGKYLNDELETLKTYIYQGSQDGVINRLKEVLDFLAGESESTTLLDLLNSKADKSTTYTKTEANALLDEKADADNVYPIAVANTLLDAKADKSTTYTKTETDTLLGAKANTNNVYAKSQTYSKTEVDDIVNDLTVGSGYEMPLDRMTAIFNDAYSDDPVINALNTLNGEVV